MLHGKCGTALSSHRRDFILVAEFWKGQYRTAISILRQSGVDSSSGCWTESAIAPPRLLYEVISRKPSHRSDSSTAQEGSRPRR